LIATIFFHGDFSSNGVYMSAKSLIAYSIGLLPIVMVKVLAPGFFARKNTKTPVRIGVIAVAVNIFMCLLLFYPMQHIGLALATSIAAMVNAALLYSSLRREGVLQTGSGWLLLLGKILIASLLMAAVLWWGMGGTDQWLEQSVYYRITKITLLVGAGILVYFSVLYFLGLRVKSFWLERGAE
jgi:putative peptidoglycan lipid II flippase